MMTPEQMITFIEILQFGFSTSSASRFDCLRSFIQAYPARKDEAIAAAAAFERGCCYSPEQKFAMAEMSDQQFAEWVESRGRSKNEPSI